MADKRKFHVEITTVARFTIRAKSSFDARVDAEAAALVGLRQMQADMRERADEVSTAIVVTEK